MVKLLVSLELSSCWVGRVDKKASCPFHLSLQCFGGKCQTAVKGEGEGSGSTRKISITLSVLTFSKAVCSISTLE